MGVLPRVCYSLLKPLALKVVTVVEAKVERWDWAQLIYHLVWHKIFAGSDFCDFSTIYMPKHLQKKVLPHKFSPQKFASLAKLCIQTLQVESCSHYLF